MCDIKKFNSTVKPRVNLINQTMNTYIELKIHTNERKAWYFTLYEAWFRGNHLVLQPRCTQKEGASTVFFI